MSNKIHTMVTNQILTLMSKGVCPWAKGWKDVGGIAPFNAESGRQYNGINACLCAIKADGKIPAFTTANAALGRYPKKGSEGVVLIRPRIKTELNDQGEKVERFFGIGYVRVFSVYDIQGYDTLKLEEKYASCEDDGIDFNPIGVCEAIVTDMINPPEIEHGGNRAYYRPSTDSIGMPEKKNFASEDGYYHILFHELVHSTMHITRLDRKKSREGLETRKHEYSFEELVAELGACFLACETGIQTDATLKNSASYLKSWIKPLQDNPDWIMKASSQASKAVKYITA